MSQQRAIGILGGTFDPVHIGHLNLAWQAYQQLQLDEVWFIPNRLPPHKTQSTPVHIRIDMLHIAIQDIDAFTINSIELDHAFSGQPSYTFNTLQYLSSQKSEHDYFYFLMGSDSFHTLNTWYRWQDLRWFAHLIVGKRPYHGAADRALADTLIQYKKQYLTEDIADLKASKNQMHGHIFELEMPQIQVASDTLRSQIKNQIEPKFLVPDTVLHFIKTQKVY